MPSSEPTSPTPKVADFNPFTAPLQSKSRYRDQMNHLVRHLAPKLFFNNKARSQTLQTRQSFIRYFKGNIIFIVLLADPIPRAKRVVSLHGLSHHELWFVWPAWLKGLFWKANVGARQTLHVVPPTAESRQRRSGVPVIPNRSLVSTRPRASRPTTSC